MKIVDMKTFLSTPEGTVFAKYTPSCFDRHFDDLSIKGETLSDEEFYYQDLVGPIELLSGLDWDATVQDAYVTRIRLELNFHSQHIDDCCEADQLFAVWDRRDVTGLISCLTRALGMAK